MNNKNIKYDGQHCHWDYPIDIFKKWGKIKNEKISDVIEPQHGIQCGAGIEKVEYQRTEDNTLQVGYIVWGTDGTDTYYTWYKWLDNRMTAFRAGKMLRQTHIYKSILKNLKRNW